VKAREAFFAEYFPRLQDVYVPDEHVRAVMDALQREIDREARRRQEKRAVFSELPWERQQALAEWRRYWFGKFGITPETWPSGKLSLWDISEDPVPPEMAHFMDGWRL